MTCLEIWETPQALAGSSARARHVAKLQADLESSRAVLSAELKEARLGELFRQHLALQDALITELLSRLARCSELPNGNCEAAAPA